VSGFPLDREAVAGGERQSAPKLSTRTSQLPLSGLDPTMLYSSRSDVSGGSWAEPSLSQNPAGSPHRWPIGRFVGAKTCLFAGESLEIDRSLQNWQGRAAPGLEGSIPSPRRHRLAAGE
jgi:hypothetical protein